MPSFRQLAFAACVLALPAQRGALYACPASAQEVIDRIIARVENDVILLSDLRNLQRYQLLVDGNQESDALALDRLIDQWIVRSEANASRFPQPSADEIDRGLDRLRKSFDSPADYEARKKASGLTGAQIRAMMASQLYLGNYLDSRFRPSARVDSQQIEDFYNSALVPAPRRAASSPQPSTLRAKPFRKLSSKRPSPNKPISGSRRAVRACTSKSSSMETRNDALRPPSRLDLDHPYALGARRSRSSCRHRLFRQRRWQSHHHPCHSSPHSAIHRRPR